MKKKDKKANAASRGKMPSKRTINLAGIGDESINWKLGTPAIILIVLLAAVFGKFAVADRLSALDNAQQKAGEMSALVDEANAKVESYGELVEEYAHYTYSGMTSQELALQDRVDIMDMLQRVVMSQCELNSWSITDNQVELTLTGSSLQEINRIAQQLQAESMVDFCTVSTAATNDYSYTQYQTNGDVTAHVTVYLVNKEA